MPDRTTPPRLTTLTTPTILPYQQLRLINGMEVYYIHDPDQEVFKMDIVFEGGIYYQSHPLVASTSINMLNEGTTCHDAEAIADLFDYYGAYVDFSSGLNKSEINLISLTKYAGETIAMIAEMVNDSIIPEKELKIYLRNKNQEFLVNQEKTAYLARKKFSELLFGAQHPYANRISENDFQQVTSGMIRDFYKQYLNANHCRIIACGNVNTTVLQHIQNNFSKLTVPEKLPSPPQHVFQPSSPGKYHVLKNNAVQTSLRVGKTGVRLTDEDYAGFMLLNTILGGYFGSRLMSNIREEKGYTYGINSFNVSMPLSSYWCIATDVNSGHTEATIEEIFKEIRKLQTEPVPEKELELVKNFLHGDLLRELDGVFAQSDTLKHKLNYGLDNRIYLEIIRKIKSCTAADLLELANKHWDTEKIYVVTAGQ